MRIVTKIWLGMTILVVGYVMTVVGNDIQSRRGEAFLARVDRSLAPSVNAAQEAVTAFKQLIIDYEDSVIAGDLTALTQAATNGAAALVALHAIGDLGDLPSSRTREVRHLASRIVGFQTEADVVYRKIAATPTATDMATRAADLNRRMESLRDDLAALERSLRADMHTAIEEQRLSVAIQRQVGDAVLIVILLGTIAGAVGLTRRWSSRLAILMEASRRLASGDYETRVEVTGSDETGQLGSGFEQVRHAISDRDLSLRVFNDTLEQQIRDRTRELESRNRDLSTEIAVRHRAEENLRMAHEEAESMLGSLGAALVGLDADDRVTRWNSAAERLFGSTAETTIGRLLVETGIRCDWAEIFVAIAACVKDKRPIEVGELRYEDQQNELRWLSVTVSSSRAQDGSRPGRGRIILLATDITQRRLDEIQRNHGAKLESIGQLAAGIAHEINTPIQFIGDNLLFLAEAHGSLKTLREAHQRAFEAIALNAPVALVTNIRALELQCDSAYLDSEVPKAIAQSQEGVARVADIVKGMKAFSHPDQGGLIPSDINAAVRTTIAVARNEYKYVAELVTDLDPALPLIPCHAGGIHQVLLNLLVNAAHAVADVVQNSGTLGTITIQTRRDGEFVAVSITDTGTGIPEAVQPKLFTPFFTTKGVGKGTGQGLNLAHATIVKQHGGTISFQTAVGHGTTFLVRIPIQPSSTVSSLG